MFEVTGLEIAQLRDDDLRSLVGMLCEAEHKLCSLPIAGVTWGGHQDAADGGIDVRVDSEFDIEGSGFLTKGKTGFQVKKPDMQKGKIESEMRPKNKLRKPIIELAKEGGAYIIVSSKSSATDSALSERIDAMNEALFDLEEKDHLTLAFYDQDQMASWVNFHPSMMFWVKEKLRKETLGWQPFKDWSKRSFNIDGVYHVDNKTRIFKGVTASNSEFSTIDGINEIRQTLSKARTSVRIVGLSGVGKTRLLQALFDERIGKNALNHYQVVYGDISDELVPSPTNFAERLILLDKPLILIVDNCPPRIHRTLTLICSKEECKVSLITVEYDIKEDQPEETTVYRIEPVSNDLIVDIVRAKFPHISYENIRKIAEFSGGNARIAYALAGTIIRDESLSYLKDSELFKRLFVQRNADDASLMAIAEVCSLVYSFDSRTTEGNDSEMNILSSLININKQELHRGIAKLKRRNLVQQRNYWCAILPHAIANRLASTALENIPFEEILMAFESNGDRLLKSFSNRISYLHQNKFAEQVAERWFSDVGLLKDLVNLNGLGITLFRNVAPINLEATLIVIERNIEQNEKVFLSFNSYKFEDFAHAIVLVAYNGQYFLRCVRILTQYYGAKSSNKDKEWLESKMRPLFYIRYSKTHAPLQDRLDFIKSLVFSVEKDNNVLGFLMLESCLKTREFRPQSWSGNFNSKHHDLGFFPKKKKEILDWYSMVLKFCETLIHEGKELESKTKEVLSRSFRLFWCDILQHKYYSELFDCFSEIGKVNQWNEGWIAVRTTIRYSSEKASSDALKKLHLLEKELAPQNLIDKVRAYAFSDYKAIIGLMGGNRSDRKDDWQKVYKITAELGSEVAQDHGAFNKLKREMVIAKYVHNQRLFQFGKGVASINNSTSGIWDKLVEEYKSTPIKSHNYEVLFGYLSKLSKVNLELSNRILDNALEDEFLITIFSSLQSHVKIDNAGYERLLQSLHIGRTPIENYRSLAHENAHSNLNDNQLVGILEKIILKEEGISVTFQILGRRFIDLDDSKKHKHSSRLQLFGREFLLNFDFKKDVDRMMYLNSIGFNMSYIVTHCFTGNVAKNDAEELCNNMKEYCNAYSISNQIIYFSDAIINLAKTQPYSFLEGILGKTRIEDNRIVADIASISKENPFNLIEDDLIIEWCKEEPSNRYKKIASCADLYQKSIVDDQLELSPIARLILAEAPDLISVLEVFSRKLIPSMWSGPRADFLGKRLPILNSLIDDENPTISNWAIEQRESLELDIERSSEDIFPRYDRGEERFE